MTATFYVGDALQVMATLPAKSVDLILSSPPFLALRSYLPADHPHKALEGGSQATPGAYIDWLISVVEACARILAPHGSLCFELGDTYAGSGGAGGDYAENGLREGQPKFRQAGARGGGAGHMEHRKQDEQFFTAQPGGRGWPLAKSLSLIPELFRYTLVYGQNPLTGRTTERWRLRNIIRWVRPNPPVGALGDKFRPATSELMVFCKSAKRFFDLDAVRTPHARDYSEESPTKANREADRRGRGRQNTERSLVADPAGSPPLDWWNVPLLEGEEPSKYGPKVPERRDHTTGISNKALKHSLTKGKWGEEEESRLLFSNPAGAPPLDWWNIPPGGYEGAHYAVWPPELCVKPIKAMSPEKVCRKCGEPRRRIVGDVSYVSTVGGRVVNQWDGERRGSNVNQWTVDGGNPGHAVRSVETCGHDNWRPGLVLDPFAGSGTTLAVATGHGRDAIGIDLDERNYDLALERVGPLILQRGETAA